MSAGACKIILCDTNNRRNNGKGKKRRQAIDATLAHPVIVEGLAEPANRDIMDEVLALYDRKPWARPGYEAANKCLNTLLERVKDA